MTGTSTGRASTTARLHSKARRAPDLHQSEGRFRALFEEAPIAYHEIDRQGVIRQVNKAACRLLAFEPEELIGRQISDFMLPEEREISREAIRRHIAGEESIAPFERKYVSRDGTIRVVEIHESLIRDRSNRVVGIRSAMLDITERKRVEKALRESEERYRELFENANDIVFTIDLEGNFTSLNKTGEQITSYNRKEQLHISQIMAPEQAQRARQMIQRKLASKESTRYELEIIAKDGRKVPLEVSTRLIFRDGKPVGIQGIARDITERKQAEEARRESEERYELAVCGANDGLWDWNLKTGQIYFSPRWKSMLGHEESAIGSAPEDWFSRVHPEDVGRLQMDVAIHLEGHNPHFENEHRMRHKDGTYRWMLSRGLAVTGADGKALRMAGSQTDVTMRKLAEERLLYDAFHDELTGLPNRALFMERLERTAVRAMRRENYLFAVLFLDLDRFKVINDSLGHMMGDQLLVAIARRLEQCLRPEDTVARLGGDEFVVLCDDLKSISDATQLAERIQKELRQPFHLGGHEVFTTASIGIALSTTGYQQPADLLRDADTVMYRAKALGRARYEVYRAGMHTRALERLRLETDLRMALDRQEFLVHYQPIVARESGEIRTVEALLRWQHGYRGLVYPDQFVHVAEETGVILPIDEWMLRSACAQTKAWQMAGFPHLGVSVNLSARQFKHPNLVETVTRIVQETGLDPHYLALELTESAVLNDVQSTIEALQQLCAMGIRISIDDFGTGYCSLKYLLRFPISTVKLDRSFVRDIDIDSNSAAIATAVITMAHSLKLNVVAEGVETEEQLEFLHLRGCDQIQGHLFSKPLPPDKLTPVLARRYLSATRPAAREAFLAPAAACDGYL